MKQIIAIMIVLAMLIAVPLSTIAQVMEPEPAPIDDTMIAPGEPINISDPYWYYWPEQGGFDYADGVANGTYVDFLLDESTGTISDYTSKLVDYNFYYPMMYYDGQREEAPGYGAGYYPEPTEYIVKFFDSITFGDFVPNGHPGAFGQSLVFLGENEMMTFSDYQGGSMFFQFGKENGTMTFTVPDGVEITKTPHYYDLYEISEEEKIGIDYATDGGGSAANYDYDCPECWYWNYDEAYLKIGNITCSIWVDRGSIEILDNKIVVSTFPGAYVSTYSWIEYGWMYKYSEPWFLEGAPSDDKGAITGAIESGLMAAVGYLFMGDGGNHYNDSQTLNDPSFKLEFMNVEQNRFQVEVKSEIKAGRIVTLNVNKQALNAESQKDIKVLLDDEKIKACGSMEELVDLQGGTKAGYYMVSGNEQSTIFVYVPHFSTHVITVGLADSVPTVLIPVLFAIGFVAVVAALIVMRGKKNRDEL